MNYLKMKNQANVVIKIFDANYGNDEDEQFNKNNITIVIPDIIYTVIIMIINMPIIKVVNLWH